MEGTFVPELLQEHLTTLLLIPPALLGPLDVFPFPLALIHGPSSFDFILLFLPLGLGKLVAMQPSQFPKTPGLKVGCGLSGIIKVRYLSQQGWGFL